ncbi:DUF4291 family protein [Nocardia implantans]|uniref:DUF4291 family protein n=1 Tax=Nocardia implantans TaxID=3108168 RepID=A0ABU6B0L5_9NOCA|nr:MULTISPECIES: DUF4291 family protein [unclassified Nocardia]MBF6195196.1 DUF4291 family protein [Nocardia beijingensis]MEA3530758.1 DUF4291 family protein [Nocardia sp. CDC192]MEB3513112.1 DUF4291 family protein [Nocardia sp. CDC186]
MTWTKPSFSWMRCRCGWTSEPGRELGLAVAIGASF